MEIPELRTPRESSFRHRKKTEFHLPAAPRAPRASRPAPPCWGSLAGRQRPLGREDQPLTSATISAKNVAPSINAAEIIMAVWIFAATSG